MDLPFTGPLRRGKEKTWNKQQENEKEVEGNMWRKLSNEEKSTLLANIKLGTYVTRFVLGIWLIFVSLYYISGIKEACNSFTSGNTLNGVAILFGMALGAIVFYGIPIYLFVTGGTDLKLLESDEAYIGSAFYISSYHTNLRSGRRKKYVATVKLIDEYGNAYQKVECESVGDPDKYCKEGDRVDMLRIGDRLLCMPKKLM